jgi:hypothetical protein
MTFVEAAKRTGRALVMTTAAVGAASISAMQGTAYAQRGGGFHGGMGFHQGFRHDGFHHHRIFIPRFGFRFGLPAFYGIYGWPGYGYYTYPYYDDSSYDPPYAYSYPNYYPTPVPYAPNYGGYPMQAGGNIGSLGAQVEPLPPTEVKPSAPPATQPSNPLLGLTRRPPKPASSDAAADPRLPDVRLTGIVIERDRRIAIFAVTGTTPLELSEGDAVKDWRLDSISPQMVSFSGPAGTMTLALNADTSPVRQPPAAGPAEASP